VAKPEDEAYFRSLYQVWELVGINDKVDMGGAYYRRGESFLKRRDYSAASVDFERAIALGHTEAVQRRELVVHLQEHISDEKRKLQEAEEETKQQALALAKQKEDETKRLKKAEDFYNGGIYHLKNGDYARSLADLEEAKHYGHSDAVRMLKEVLAKQKEVEETKQQALALAKQKEAEEVKRQALALAKQKEAEKNQITIDGKVTIELVNIPAGSFMMGDDDGDDDEKPAHRVTLKAFQMSKYPITQQQYQAVMGTNPSHFKDDENCPVETVSWHDAFNFCEELSKRIGQKVKLPTEAQWEYACRAGSTGKYCFGDDVRKLGDYAWYKENAGSETHPVGEKLANPWGLHDMYGNVWEWCEDVWHGNYNGAPSDGSAWLTGGEQNRRALRGGSWFGNGIFCRSANRGRNYAVNRIDIIGFRVVV
jgi:formylglycine-generating enzyme required for sulfatase activity